MKTFLVSIVLTLYAIIKVSTFQIGSGLADITGPAAEVRFMGYANLNQVGAGIHMRLWARAYIVVNDTKRVVIVNTDLAFTTQAVKMAVGMKIKEEYKNLYDIKNILISATHTHSAPGGYSNYIYENISILGFHKGNFDRIVNGIVLAIKRAHENLQNGKIYINKGKVQGGNDNRAPEPYQLNLDKDDWETNTDEDMTVLKFVKDNGQDIGAIVYYASHGVSLPRENNLVSPDNKGYASYLLEKSINNHSNYYTKDMFVAAFVQTNEGDVSPCPAKYSHCKSSKDDFENLELQSIKQYKEAKSLYDQATEEVTGAIDFRHKHADFSNLLIEPKFIDGIHNKTTCPAAFGWSITSGAYNETGLEFLSQHSPSWWSHKCQGVKKILLPAGKMYPYSWEPQILPIQLFRIGKLAIIAVPGEFTTMSGRRLRTAVQNILKNVEVNYTLIQGLSNAYASYVTTREEYQYQRYEGASTPFGEYTLNGYIQEFSKIANDLINNLVTSDGPEPLDLSKHQFSLMIPNYFDFSYLSKFGEVITQPDKTYDIGAKVTIKFYGAHLNNNFENISSYLIIQKLEFGEWIDWSHDWDNDNILRWERNYYFRSTILVEWIPKVSGTFRIIHNGFSKDLFGNFTPYQGKSIVFSVLPQLDYLS